MLYLITYQHVVTFAKKIMFPVLLQIHLNIHHGIELLANIDFQLECLISPFFFWFSFQFHFVSSWSFYSFLELYLSS